MSAVVRDEIESLRVLRDKFDEARYNFDAGVYEAFCNGEKDAKIARSVDFSREYIGKLRKKWEAEGKPRRPKRD